MKNKIVPIIKTIVFMIISTTIMILLMTLLFYKTEIDENGIRIGDNMFGNVWKWWKYVFGQNDYCYD